MVADRFDRLLTALPSMAEAVNGFESAQVQELAFQALIRALDLGALSDGSLSPNLGQAGVTVDKAKEMEKAESGTTTRRKRRRSATAAVSPARGIDFRPAGKQSLRDFIVAKQLASNHERNVAAVYYLEQVLDLSSINTGHVLAAYKDSGWREPSSITNSLLRQQTLPG
jgi:hypothetical protein